MLGVDFLFLFLLKDGRLESGNRGGHGIPDISPLNCRARVYTLGRSSDVREVPHYCHSRCSHAFEFSGLLRQFIVSFFQSKVMVRWLVFQR